MYYRLIIEIYFLISAFTTGYLFGQNNIELRLVNIYIKLIIGLLISPFLVLYQFTKQIYKFIIKFNPK